MKRNLLRTFFILLFAAFALNFTHAATITVGDGGDYSNLSDALDNASNGDVIQILSDLDISSTISISVSVTIEGTISLNGEYLGRLFNITNNATVNLSGLTIIEFGENEGDRDISATEGDIAPNAPPPIADYGGALHVESGSTLNLADCTIDDNEAVYGGGAIWNEGTLTITNCSFDNNRTNDGISEEGPGGGAIFNEGVLSCTGCTFTNNYAAHHGGAINNNDVDATLTLSNCTFGDPNNSDNKNESGSSGGAIAIYEGSTVSITNAKFYDNLSYYYGGAIFTSPKYDGNMSIDGCTFENNTASGTHGTYDHGGALAIRSYGSILSIIHSTFKENTAYEGGGAILFRHQDDGEDLTVTIDDCLFEANIAENNYGGAIKFNGYFNGTVNILNSTFIDNQSDYGGGAIMPNGDAYYTITNCIFDNNSCQSDGGAGVLLYDSNGFEISNCVFKNNTTYNGGGGGLALWYSDAKGTIAGCTFSHNETAKRGGAINIYSGELDIINTTISGNTATKTGGGINNVSNDGISLLNVTITGNTSGDEGGGICVFENDDDDIGEMTIENTLIAGNTNDDGYPDIYIDNDGELFSNGFNLIGNVGNAIFDNNTTGDQYGDPNGTTSPNAGAMESPTAIDPKLGELADNEGATQTHALLPGSPAINAASTNAPGTDQRGVSREMGPDIGAYEFQSLTTEWSGSEWSNGEPQSGYNAIISGTLTVSSNMVCDKLVVNSTVFIEAGSEIFIESGILEQNGCIYGEGTVRTTRNLNAPNMENLIGAIITCASDMGEVSVVLAFNQYKINDQVSYGRNYDLSAQNEFSNATLTLTYDDCTKPGVYEKDLQLMKSSDGGTNWMEMGGTVDLANNSITVTGIDSFSIWTFWAQPVPVPLSSWSLILGIILIVIITTVKLRR